MALQKTFTMTGSSQVSGDFWSSAPKEEQVVADFYVKVVSVSGTKDGMVAKVSFEASNVTGFKVYNFVPSMDGPNFIKQSYEYLKTLDEFANAKDV